MRKYVANEKLNSFINKHKMNKNLTTFEKCLAIRRTILICAGESIMYNSWDQKLENLSKAYKVVSDWEKEYGSFKIDPNDMTMEELEKLDFMKWDESNLMLIPIWLYPYLADKLKTTTITKVDHTTKDEITTDHRWGCLAHGVFK